MPASPTSTKSGASPRGIGAEHSHVTDAVCSLGVDLLLAASAIRKARKFNVLIRLVGGTPKLAMSQDCDTRKEFQGVPLRGASVRMSAVVLFRRYRRRPESSSRWRTSVL